MTSLAVSESNAVIVNRGGWRETVIDNASWVSSGEWSDVGPVSCLTFTVNAVNGSEGLRAFAVEYRTGGFLSLYALARPTSTLPRRAVRVAHGSAGAGAILIAQRRPDGPLLRVLLDPSVRVHLHERLVQRGARQLLLEHVRHDHGGLQVVLTRPRRVLPNHARAPHPLRFRVRFQWVNFVGSQAVTLSGPGASTSVFNASTPASYQWMNLGTAQCLSISFAAPEGSLGLFGTGFALEYESGALRSARR